MAHEVGAGFLAEEAGVPIRTIQFWTDAGVLRALPGSDRQGRGRHRVYDATPPLYGERAWTLIAAEMHRMRLPVGVMKYIIWMLRRSKIPERQSIPYIQPALGGESAVLIVSPANEVDPISDDNLEIGFIDSDLSFSSGQGSYKKRSGYLLNLTQILHPLTTGS